jgi:dipeptidase E
VVKDLASKGVVYAGGSAGAVLAGPDIEAVAALDDPAEAPNLKSTKALGLVDFVILPHYGSEKYMPMFKSIQDQFSDKYKLIPLRNNQVVMVDDITFQIVDSE